MVHLVLPSLFNRPTIRETAPSPPSSSPLISARMAARIDPSREVTGDHVRALHWGRQS
jgi:hypothetical protein